MIPLKDDIPTRRTPIVTLVLIAINVIVYFVFEQGLWDLGITGNERVVDYGAIPQLRFEAREKLSRIRPASIGQAGRVSGITPADLAVLLLYLK